MEKSVLKDSQVQVGTWMAVAEMAMNKVPKFFGCCPDSKGETGVELESLF